MVENLITTEDTLLSKRGLEGSRVDELVAKYGNLSDAIKAKTKEKLQEDRYGIKQYYFSGAVLTRGACIFLRKFTSCFLLQA